MASQQSQPTPSNAATHVRRGPIVPNVVLGVVIFIITEAMLFGGLISAYVIAESGAAPGTWPPVGQPRLPVEATAFNTVILLASAVFLAVANNRFRPDTKKANSFVLTALGLGTFFLVFQGWEWVSLITQGMTLYSSNHGAFFYLLVGMHGLHVFCAITVLGGIYMRARSGQLTGDVLKAVSIYWYFVVGLWPFLYWQVYL